MDYAFGLLLIAITIFVGAEMINILWGKNNDH